MVGISAVGISDLLQDTCLASIPAILKLLAEAFDWHGATAWQGCEPAVLLLRAVLAPVVENASAAYLAAENPGNPGTAKAIDIVLAEAVASGLGNLPSMKFLHHILGTSVHFTLLR